MSLIISLQLTLNLHFFLYFKYFCLKHSALHLTFLLYVYICVNALIFVILPYRFIIKDAEDS